MGVVCYGVYVVLPWICVELGGVELSCDVVVGRGRVIM